MQDRLCGAGMRRWGRALALAGMTGLAACQSAPRLGESGVASADAAAYLKEIRSEHGLPPLASDPRLERAALKQSGYMASSGRMAHDTGWGKDFATRMKKEGIDGVAAENLAHGRMDLKKLFNTWMNSQGHRRNMLDPRLSRFGLAYVRAGKGSAERYWTLVVGD